MVQPNLTEERTGFPFKSVKDTPNLHDQTHNFLI